MKNICFYIFTLFTCMGIFAQQHTVAVTSFDVQGGSTQEEAGIIYELFIAELVSTKAVTVVDRVNLDRILAEMRFQASDWSNPEKTASLGKALNADIIVQNRLMKLGNYIYWTATMLDVKTAKIMGSAWERINNLEEVWNSLPRFCKQLVERINKPVPYLETFPNVAVATFDVQGGITPQESVVVTELFIASLVATGQINVIDRTNFDKIIEEMQFQTSDWSNSGKTTELGKVLNANSVIRGQLMKMGNTIFWTSTVLDVNTAQILSSSRQQLNSLDEIWGDVLRNTSQSIVSQLPPPNLFAGRWQAVQSVNKKDLICILNIKTDGTIIVERYDTITQTQNRVVDGGNTVINGIANLFTLGIFYDDIGGVEYKTETSYSSQKNGTGTGVYDSVIRNGDNINTTISLDLKEIVSGVSTNPKTTIVLNLKNPDSLSASNLNSLYNIYQEKGTTKNSEARNGFNNFTRLN